MFLSVSIKYSGVLKTGLRELPLAFIPDVMIWIFRIERRNKK
jgi:hypothetical protein